MSDTNYGWDKRQPSSARVEQAGEITVQALVARDKLVGEGQARHQAPLLQPENGAEAAPRMGLSMGVLAFARTR